MIIGFYSACYVHTLMAHTPLHTQSVIDVHVYDKLVSRCNCGLFCRCERRTVYNPRKIAIVNKEGRMVRRGFVTKVTKHSITALHGNYKHVQSINSRNHH